MSDIQADPGSSNFLQTPAGLAILQAALGTAGGAVQGAGQVSMQNSQNQFSAQELLQQLMNSNFQQNQSNDLSRANSGVASTQMNPAAQAQGLSSALVKGNMLQNMRPSSVNAPAFLKGMVPTFSGGAMGAIPQGGFGSDITGALSPQGVLSSANDFAKQQSNLNPAVPSMDLSPAFGQAGVQSTQNNEAYRTGQLNQLQGGRNAQQTALTNALTAQQSSDNAPGFWHKFASIAGPIAGYALAPFTGGLSIPVGSAIGAWGSGAGAGGIATSGALGAAGAYAGGYGQGGGGGSSTPVTSGAFSGDGTWVPGGSTFSTPGTPMNTGNMYGMGGATGQQTANPYLQSKPLPSLPAPGQ